MPVSSLYLSVEESEWVNEASQGHRSVFFRVLIQRVMEIEQETGKLPPWVMEGMNRFHASSRSRSKDVAKKPPSQRKGYKPEPGFRSSRMELKKVRDEVRGSRLQTQAPGVGSGSGLPDHAGDVVVAPEVPPPLLVK